MTSYNVLRVMVQAILATLFVGASVTLPAEPMRADLEVSGDNLARPAQIYRDDRNVYVLVQKEQLGKVSIFDAGAQLILRPQTASFNVPITAAPFVIRVGDSSAVVALPARLPKSSGIAPEARSLTADSPSPANATVSPGGESSVVHSLVQVERQTIEATTPSSSTGPSSSPSAGKNVDTQVDLPAVVVATASAKPVFSAAAVASPTPASSEVARELPLANQTTAVAPLIGDETYPSPIAALRLSTTLSLSGSRAIQTDSPSGGSRPTAFRAKAGTRLSAALRKFAAEHDWGDLVWRATSDYQFENDVVFEGASFAQALQKALEPFALSAELYRGNRAILILEGPTSK